MENIVKFLGCNFARFFKTIFNVFRKGKLMSMIFLLLYF